MGSEEEILSENTDLKFNRLFSCRTSQNICSYNWLCALNEKAHQQSFQTISKLRIMLHYFKIQFANAYSMKTCTQTMLIVTFGK